jgi:hypothetical protein
MMKLFINDKCLERLFEMPKAISRKVLDFQKKFRENSRSSAINLESISTFKDKNLRTARIDQKYRAIIRVPETGDNYYLLWVDNHDEAMDWAKNKIFEWNESTQTAQIFTSPDLIEKGEIKGKDLFEGLFTHYSNEDLVKIGVPESYIDIIKNLKDLNDLEMIEKDLPEDAFENLFYLSEGINIDKLIVEINEGKMLSVDLDEQFSSINNRRFFVEIDDEVLTELLNGDLSKWQIFLHPSQRKLVERDFNGSVKITGGAGTGKTVVALHRLKYLTETFDLSENRKVLMTTFTNALSSNLVSLAKKLHADESKFTIVNIDAVAREYAMKENLIDRATRILDFTNSKKSIELWEEFLEQNLSEFDSVFLDAEYQGVILYNDVKSLETYLKTSRIGRGKPISRKQKMEFWALVEKYERYKAEHLFIDRSELFNLVTNHLNATKKRPYCHVISDEIQDFSNVELRFLRSLVDEKDNDLFLVGDPYQKIYAKKINFSAAGISVRGNRSKQLRINYRTSEEIKRLALSTVKGLSYDNFDGEDEKLKGYLSLFHGERPSYEIFKTKQEEIDYLISQIKILKSQEFNYSDIAIGFRTKDALKEVKTALHKLKIPYNDNSVSNMNDATGVLLSTLHSLKGLEFKAVFIADVNNRTCPYQVSSLSTMDDLEKEEYFNRERSLMYVAMTRAINILKITGVGVKSELIGL